MHKTQVESKLLGLLQKDLDGVIALPSTSFPAVGLESYFWLQTTNNKKTPTQKKIAMHPLDGHISRLTHDNVCSDGRVAGAIHDWSVYAVPDQTEGWHGGTGQF